ncbi:hypothetical protein CDD81_5274 [Ophiocordyceps australis]|uniref:Kinetochore protein mis13 n=1 Tax=Ophiocordyceps australis TaxID=1399860 RepID=A0A2C5YI02_9HYPO|nr:hypothetical protein CDD81_5274 [Ophiocordyceps australis]
MSEQQKRRTSKRLAAATEYEQDDDFQFIRKSKRVKTEEQEPVKKATRGRPPAKDTSLKATSVKTETPKAAAKATAAAAAAATTNAGTSTRRSSRRKASLDVPPDELQPQPQPKAKVTRKATRQSKRLSGDPIAEEVETNGAVPRRRGRTKVKKDARIEEEAEELSARQQQQQHKQHEPEPLEEPRPPLPPQQQVPVESAKITLPMSDTPIINRNKEMRKKGNSNRRSSLGSRGRRASSLIENGQTAIPHRDVDPSEFYKHIEADGLPEPRRMKQLLMWCGERALVEKPPLGTCNSNAILGARAIQDQLLKDFASKSEFSNWFSRDDEPKPDVVLEPNPRNLELDEKMASLEEKVKRLQIEKKTWLEVQKQPPPEHLPLFSPQELEAEQIQLPDFDLLDAEEGKIRNSLADAASSYAAMRRQAEERLGKFQSGLEFEIDFLADNVHKLEQCMVVAGQEADEVLKLGAARLRLRELRDRAGAGTRDLPVMEVLRSLSGMLPEGSGG